MSDSPITWQCPDDQCLTQNAPGSAECHGCGHVFGVMLTERVLAHLEANAWQSRSAQVIAWAVGSTAQAVAMACQRLRAEGKIDAWPTHPDRPRGRRGKLLYSWPR